MERSNSIKKSECPHVHKYNSIYDVWRFGLCVDCEISDNCLSKENKPKDSNYSELLKHPDWQRKRLEILQRDDFTCQICHDKETTLHVHHKKYKANRKPWEYENDDLTTVCKYCHATLEVTKDKYHQYKINKIEALLFNIISEENASLRVYKITQSTNVNIIPEYDQYISMILTNNTHNTSQVFAIDKEDTSKLIDFIK
jgi:hypothetical protein